MTSNSGPDRLALLRGHATLTGIDYINVDATQTVIAVHFINPPSAGLMAALGRADVTLTPDPVDGLAAPDPVALSWIGPAANRRLRLEFPEPGPFGFQRLTIAHADIDPYYNDIQFSFKANCTSLFDCKSDETCSDEPGDRPAIGYLARDFESYRQTLFDFAASRWPDWSERHEADVGVMLMGVMAAMGDELAYYQDRAVREAHLGTATQPRSRRAHARLVSYEIAPPLAASTLIDVQVDAVAGNPAGALPAGTPVWAEAQTGDRIQFEVGKGLADIRAGASYAVDSALNTIAPYLWDEDQICLDEGASALWLEGALAAALPLTETLADGTPSRTVLIRTDPQDPDNAGAPAHRLLVSITGHEESTDPLTGESVTRVTLSEPTTVDLDLESLSVRANLIPVTAGSLRELDFVVGARDDADPAIPDDIRAGVAEGIERDGTGAEPRHRAFLDETDERALCWLSPDATAAGAVPEIDVAQLSWNGAALAEESQWTWRRSFLGSASSLPDSTDYTLEDGRWAEVRKFSRPEGDVLHRDYFGPFGQTLLFGDGEFGLAPARGTIFRVRYRIGGGARSNVGPEAIRHISDLPPGLVVSVSNPLAAANGADAETPAAARRDAPEAWKAVTHRAVRPEDYSEAAERLDWVDRAASRSLWTGSWQTVFTTPDPRDMATLPDDRRAELEDWLDRFRQTGRDTRVADPVYADLDFEITVCVERDRERSDVARRVRDRLSSRPGAFFDPNRRSFADGVERARLEAEVHAAGGVRAVERIRFRRRGWFDWRDMGARYVPEGGAEIVRVQSNPQRPDRGSVSLLMEGGS